MPGTADNFTDLAEQIEARPQPSPFQGEGAFC